MHPMQFGVSSGSEPILAETPRRMIYRILEILRESAERNCYLLSIAKLEDDYKRLHNENLETMVRHVFNGKSLIEVLKDELSASIVVIENADPIMIQLRTASNSSSQAMISAPRMMLQPVHPAASYGTYANLTRHPLYQHGTNSGGAMAAPFLPPVGMQQFAQYPPCYSNPTTSYCRPAVMLPSIQELVTFLRQQLRLCFLQGAANVDIDWLFDILSFHFSLIDAKRVIPNLPALIGQYLGNEVIVEQQPNGQCIIRPMPIDCGIASTTIRPINVTVDGLMPSYVTFAADTPQRYSSSLSSACSSPPPPPALSIDAVVMPNRVDDDRFVQMSSISPISNGAIESTSNIVKSVDVGRSNIAEQTANDTATTDMTTKVVSIRKNSNEMLPTSSGAGAAPAVDYSSSDDLDTDRSSRSSSIAPVESPRSFNASPLPNTEDVRLEADRLSRIQLNNENQRLDTVDNLTQLLLNLRYLFDVHKNGIALDDFNDAYGVSIKEDLDYEHYNLWGISDLVDLHLIKIVCEQQNDNNSTELVVFAGDTLMQLLVLPFGEPSRLCHLLRDAPNHCLPIQTVLSTITIDDNFRWTEGKLFSIVSEYRDIFQLDLDDNVDGDVRNEVLITMYCPPNTIRIIPHGF